MNSHLRVLLPYLLVLAGAAFLFWNTLHFEFMPRGDRPGPDVWPRAILALMMVTCAARIATVWRRRPGDDGGALDGLIGEAPADTDPEAPPARRYPLLLATGIALTIAYVGLLGTLGFFTGTVLYIAALARTGRYRRWPVIVAVALGGALFFMFVFMKVVYLSLPLGRPPFEAISLALMQLLRIR